MYLTFRLMFHIKTAIRFSEISTGSPYAVELPKLLLPHEASKILRLLIDFRILVHDIFLYINVGYMYPPFLNYVQYLPIQ